MRRWRRYIVVGCLVVPGALAAAALAGPGTARQGNAGPGKAEQAARRDATRLLARVVLPPGVSASAGEPAGDGHGLSGPGSFPALTKHVDRHRWWTTAQPLAAVNTFLHTHVPAGARRIASGYGGPPPSAFVAYAFPPVGRVLGTRWLVVSIVGLAGGGTGLRVDADVQWIVPRPSAERIPRSVRVLDVSVGPPHAAPSTRVTVVNRAKVARLASWINGLGITQPGALNCPARPGDAPVVTFTFRRTLDGPVIARASELASAVEPTTACDPMTLRIEGRGWPPLLGGAAVVHAAQRLLGVRLARG